MASLKIFKWRKYAHIFFFFVQNADSSDEESLHIDTEAKTDVKGRNSKVSKKKGGSAAGILDLLQASKQVGGIDYTNNRYTLHTMLQLLMSTSALILKHSLSKLHMIFGFGWKRTIFLSDLCAAASEHLILLAVHFYRDWIHHTRLNACFSNSESPNKWCLITVLRMAWDNGPYCCLPCSRLGLFSQFRQ